MLKAKYQMHRLVNILFYGIMWFSGFLVGLGVKGSENYGLEKVKDIFINIFN